MIVIIGAVLGAMSGFLVAKRRGGNRLDIVQYACVHALIFAITGLFIMIAAVRMF